jgi:hypothetical protein
MWWKLTGLGAIEAALIVVLFWPIKTHAVKIDIPDTGPTHTLQLTLGAVSLAASVAAYAIAIAAILIPIWIAYRVIAKRKTR